MEVVVLKINTWNEMWCSWITVERDLKHISNKQTIINSKAWNNLHLHYTNIFYLFKSFCKYDKHEANLIRKYFRIKKENLLINITKNTITYSHLWECQNPITYIYIIWHYLFGFQSYAWVFVQRGNQTMKMTPLQRFDVITLVN